MRIPITIFLASVFCLCAVAKPRPIIFDTDLGGDTDDILAVVFIRSYLELNGVDDIPIRHALDFGEGTQGR